MEDKVIATFSKNARETVRVMLTTYQGRDLIDIRSCVEGESGLVPTRKGLTISIDLIEKLKECLQKAKETLEAEKK